ncbi:ATP-binding protein [Leptolyngbya sp. AN02str]|uniref:ATP-binding protein n=1 Tax=Leptolyngbya sp. AN02str TaxID=3423363 RepID=UPI003D317DAF
MFRQTSLVVRSDLMALNYIEDWFRQFCQRNGSGLFWLKGQEYPLELALVEGFSNAVRHAHHELPKETQIKIDVSLWDDRIEIRIWDQGKPFDPNSLEEPKPGTLRLGGYGWFLLRRLADRVEYERCRTGGNCLLIVKYGLARSRMLEESSVAPN